MIAADARGTLDPVRDAIADTPAGGRDSPRILFLIRSLGCGGAERQLAALATGLHRRGWNVSVTCFYAGGVFEQDLLRAGVPVIDLGKRGRWDVGGFSARLWRVLRHADADIVHGYLTVGNLLSLLARFANRRSRVVWGVRSSYIDRSRYDWMFRVTFRLSRSLARFADAIVVNSEAGAEHHAALGYPRERIRIVPNGVDTSRFRFDPAGRTRVRRQWGVPDDATLVGLVGRVDPMKDHRTFLDAAAILAMRSPRWRFVCVGGGESEYARALKSQTDTVALGNRLIWAGAREDMPSVYSALDIAASSSYGEGFPNTIAEAMSCSRPCVVTDVGDSARIVGACGAVVEPLNPAAFAAGIERTAQSLETLRADGGLPAMARSRIVARYSLESLVRNSEAAFHAVCTARTRT